jgi:hypothetical protein
MCEALFEDNKREVGCCTRAVASEGLQSVALVADKGPGAVLADAAAVTACSAMVGLFARKNK